MRQREAVLSGGGKENPSDPAFVQSLIALYDESKAVRGRASVADASILSCEHGM